MKKTVQKTAKAIVRPFKKLKHSLSTLSRSPSVVAVSDTEVDDSKQSDVDSGSFHGSSEEPGPEPTRQLLSFTRNRLSAQSIRAFLCLGSWARHDLLFDEDLVAAVKENSKRKRKPESEVEIIE